MPELPEVETMVRGIRRHCENRAILQVEFTPCLRKPIPVFPSRDAFARISGQVLTKVGRLGKRVLLELESAETVIVEPRMTGLLLVSSPPTEEHLRVQWLFQSSSGKADQLRFWDRRGLGTVSLLSPEQMLILRKRLGPDALQMTEQTWEERLPRTSRPIKVVLLDQSVVAGIGNLYASEILHVAGISPLRAACQLSRSQRALLHQATQQILREAIRYEGSTLNDGTYRNALNEDGGYQNHHLVYDKADAPCPRCQNVTIQRIVQAQRSTFYCAGCQK